MATGFCGDRLVSHSQCEFVLVRGDGARTICCVDIADGVHLRMDEGEQIDAAAVRGILSRPRKEAWADLDLPSTIRLHDLSLWHATRLRGQVVVLTAQEEAIASGIVVPAWRHGTSAIWHNCTLAYRSPALERPALRSGRLRPRP